jgi:hypothetical protein
MKINWEEHKGLAKIMVISGIGMAAIFGAASWGAHNTDKSASECTQSATSDSGESYCYGTSPDVAEILAIGGLAMSVTGGMALGTFKVLSLDKKAAVQQETNRLLYLKDTLTVEEMKDINPKFNAIVGPLREEFNS